MVPNRATHHIFFLQRRFLYLWRKEDMKNINLHDFFHKKYIYIKTRCQVIDSIMISESFSHLKSAHNLYKWLKAFRFPSSLIDLEGNASGLNYR